VLTERLEALKTLGTGSNGKRLRSVFGDGSQAVKICSHERCGKHPFDTPALLTLLQRTLWNVGRTAAVTSSSQSNLRHLSSSLKDSEKMKATLSKLLPHEGWTNRVAEHGGSVISSVGATRVPALSCSMSGRFLMKTVQSSGRVPRWR
jgi:hypothetical protein